MRKDRLDGGTGVGRCGGRVYRLALADVGLSGPDGRQLFGSVADFAILLGHFLLGESLSLCLLATAILAGIGIFLINRKG